MDLPIRERSTTKPGIKPRSVNYVTIPKALIQLLHLKKGDVLVTSEENLEKKTFRVSVK